MGRHYLSGQIHTREPPGGGLCSGGRILAMVLNRSKTGAKVSRCGAMMSDPSHLTTPTYSRRQSIEAMICDLRKVVQMLDSAIRGQQESSWIKDPSRIAFPLAARSLVTRRDNLKATIAMLRDQLELT
jgi:hypothetical protein